MSGKGMCEGSAHMVICPKNIVWCMWLNYKHRGDSLGKTFESEEPPSSSHLHMLVEKNRLQAWRGAWVLDF